MNLVAIWDALPGVAPQEAERRLRDHLCRALNVEHGTARYTHSWFCAPLSHNAPPHTGIATLGFPSDAAIAAERLLCAKNVESNAGGLAGFIGPVQVICTGEHAVEL